MLSGTPTGVYKVNDYANRTEDLWDLFKSTFEQGFLHMGHLNIPYFNLVEGHAYSIMGIHEVVDASKNVSYKLIRINNPHGVEGKFNGSWADSDPKWATYKA